MEKKYFVNEEISVCVWIPTEKTNFIELAPLIKDGGCGSKCKKRIFADKNNNQYFLWNGQRIYLENCSVNL